MAKCNSLPVGIRNLAFSAFPKKKQGQRTGEKYKLFDKLGRDVLSNQYGFCFASNQGYATPAAIWCLIFVVGVTLVALWFGGWYMNIHYGELIGGR